MDADTIWLDAIWETAKEGCGVQADNPLRYLEVAGYALGLVLPDETDLDEAAKAFVKGFGATCYRADPNLSEESVRAEFEAFLPTAMGLG